MNMYQYNVCSVGGPMVTRVGRNETRVERVRDARGAWITVSDAGSDYCIGKLLWYSAFFVSLIPNNFIQLNI